MPSVLLIKVWILLRTYEMALAKCLKAIKLIQPFKGAPQVSILRPQIFTCFLVIYLKVKQYADDAVIYVTANLYDGLIINCCP